MAEDQTTLEDIGELDRGLFWEDIEADALRLLRMDLSKSQHSHRNLDVNIRQAYSVTLRVPLAEGGNSSHQCDM